MQTTNQATLTFHFIWTITHKSCFACEMGDSVVDPELPKTDFDLDLGLDGAKDDEFVS